MKNLTLMSTWVRKPAREDMLRREMADQCPRETIYETVLNTDVLDGAFVARATPARAALYRFLPSSLAQVLEAYAQQKRYDVIISWTDVGALLFALLLKVTRKRRPHVAMMFWISKPKKAFLLKNVHSHIDRIVLWTSSHRDFAVNRLHIPASKIAYIPHYVDQNFWRPAQDVPTDMVCSAGREMRDYPTLIESMRGLDIRCHIASGEFRGIVEPTVRAIYEHGPLPPNVTVGKLTPLELRAMYARSRFVVVPLLPTDSDNGLNVILEAMAMGKAVICSRTQGQRDVIREGETGIFVPVGDPVALREAIRHLWNHPREAERMGAQGRKAVEKNHSIDLFVARLKQVVDEVWTCYGSHNGSSGKRDGASRRRTGA